MLAPFFWFRGLLGAARDLMLLVICNHEHLSFNPRALPGVIIVSLPQSCGTSSSRARKLC
jgi:hypothetical protein